MLDSIASERREMIALLTHWSSISSGSYNLPGLEKMLVTLKEAFESLGGSTEILPTGAQGSALRMRKHHNAPLQIFFGGHMDTVYGPEHSFQEVHLINSQKLNGPGVADMKGGLVVLLKTLQFLERSPYAGQIGWEVLINADEEIGSPGSDPYFKEAATRNRFGLLFEPALPDGALVSSRKGSASWTVTATGKAAHVGRNFDEGRNALTALARTLIRIEALANLEKGIFINVARIDGGGPLNVVPAEAQGKLNIRFNQPLDIEALFLHAKAILEEESTASEVQFVLTKDTFTPPKPFEGPNSTLFERLRSCAHHLGISLTSRPTGGTCDGNRLYAAGLPNLDSMGVVGGDLHTPQEYVLLDSLIERTQLTSCFLIDCIEQGSPV